MSDHSQHLQMRNAINDVELALNGLEIDSIIRLWSQADDSAPSDPTPPDREAIARLNERLADLAEANALYGKDQRLNAPDKIARNDREIAWLKDLRSILALRGGE